MLGSITLILFRHSYKNVLLSLFLNELMNQIMPGGNTHTDAWLPCQGSYKEYLSTAQVLLLYFSHLTLHEHFDLVSNYFMDVISEIGSDKLS